jgi:hypothetical protein
MTHNDLDHLFDDLDDAAHEKRKLDGLDRYHTIMRHEFDRFFLTEGERGLIHDVLKGTPASIGMILSLDAEIIEAMRSRSGQLVKKWRVDRSRFATKLESLSPSQKCAIVESFERGNLLTRGVRLQLEEW